MKLFSNTLTVQGEKLSISGGIMKGALNMAGHILKGIAEPTEDDHAASKKYADYIASHEASNALKESQDYAKDYAEKYADSLTFYLTADLAADKWKGNRSPYNQSVTVKGVTTDNAVIVGPAENSRKVYMEAEVHCSAQSNDSLTFECEEKPSSAVTVNILVTK